MNSNVTGEGGEAAAVKKKPLQFSPIPEYKTNKSLFLAGNQLNELTGYGAEDDDNVQKYSLPFSNINSDF